MPIFEYRCDNCGKTHETLELSKSDASNGCPYCGSLAINKIMSKTAPPQFKGSGWYETDYKIKKGNKDEG